MSDLLYRTFMSLLMGSAICSSVLAIFCIISLFNTETKEGCKYWDKVDSEMVCVHKRTIPIPKEEN